MNNNLCSDFAQTKTTPHPQEQGQHQQGRDCIQHPTPLPGEATALPTNLHRDRNYTSQLNRTPEEGQWAFHNGDSWFVLLKKWLINIEKRVAGGKKVFLSFCHLVLIQVSMKLVKWTFLCQQCLARQVGTRWASARSWKLLFTQLYHQLFQSSRISTPMHWGQPCAATRTSAGTQEGLRKSSSV